jgi:hypothetical protein
VNEQKAIDRIRETYAEHVKWNERLSEPAAWTPPPGSEVFEDDGDWPPRPLSQLVLSGLKSATDHLAAFADLMEGERLRPLSPDSLLRPAMLAGAQALWLVAPDDPEERRARARSLNRELYLRECEWIRDILELAQPHLDVAAGRERLRILEEHAAALKVPSPPFAATKVIRRAAEYALPPKAVYEALVVWRMTSGSAHGYHWQVEGRSSTTRLPDPESGRTVVTVRADPGDFEAAFQLGHRFAAAAWSVWDQRTKATEG